MESCIYKGHVTHRRIIPVKHFFSYKTFSFFLDLDELKTLESKISLFSLNKFNLFSFYNKDHGDRNGEDLKDWVLKVLKKYNLIFKVSKIKILCFPRILGYVFNPLSIFYCYDNNGLRAVLYEVKNTFGEQHTYVFSISANTKIISQFCNKKFYVSPFIEMKSFYNFRLSDPDEKLKILIKQCDVSNNRILIACQSGIKQPLNEKELIINFFKHPFMTLKIISGIHYEALRLWKKGAIFIKREKKIKNSISLEK